MSESLHLENIAKRYGVKQILDGVNLSLNTGDAIALVGENGAGKTTLARIIVGLEEADSGTMRLAAGTRIGYLPQEVTSDEHTTLRDYIAHTVGDLPVMEAQLRELERDLSTPERLREYGELAEEYARRGGYTLEVRTPEVMDGLGIDYLNLERELHTLSGGEKTRVHLAALLLAEPDLLVLDEPTNHLDFAGIAWLETTLAHYANALLIVTHDRAFIDKVATQIVELSVTTHQLTTYHGTYSDYLVTKQRQHEQAVAIYQGQKEELVRLKRLIVTTVHNPRKAKPISDGDKFLRYKMEQTAQQTQSKKVRDAKERLQTLEENRASKPGSLWNVVFPFQALPLTSPYPLRIENLSVTYGQRVILDKVCLEVGRGERVVLVAPNGTGKTTLLRVIAGLQMPDNGQVVLSPNAKLGFLDQEGETLNNRQNVLASFNEVLDVPLTESEILTELHRSGLFADASLGRKRVDELSTGQQRKLGLARLVASRANVLLLDEPTNHLDLLSLEALEEALLNFNGAMLAVSHDRRFVEKVATHIAHLEGGKLWLETR